MSSNFGQISPLTTELPALELLKSMYYVVATLAPSFLIGSSSFLQLISTTIKSWLSSKFGQILHLTIMELAALEHLNQRTNGPVNAHYLLARYSHNNEKVAIAIRVLT